jgi:hypothetical protein
MTEPRLRTGLWVQAQLRVCDHSSIPFVIRRRGDPDAGAVILLLNRGAPGVIVLSQTRDDQGRPAWMRPLGAELVPEASGEEFVVRTVKRDPDVWVIEVEDARGAYVPDGRIL